MQEPNSSGRAGLQPSILNYRLQSTMCSISCFILLSKSLLHMSLLCNSKVRPGLLQSLLGYPFSLEISTLRSQSFFRGKGLQKRIMQASLDMRPELFGYDYGDLGTYSIVWRGEMLSAQRVEMSWAQRAYPSGPQVSSPFGVWPGKSKPSKV